MKAKQKITAIGLFIIFIVISLLIIVAFNGNISNKILNNSSSTNPNLTLNPTLLVTVNPNNSLEFPPNDLTINSINWSSYPNLQTGYVYLVCISEPTDVIPHKFIEVQICTEIKDTEDSEIIREQLAGIAREAKVIYGPNSDINIIGTKGGVARWFASILPYEETVHY